LKLYIIVRQQFSKQLPLFTNLPLFAFYFRRLIDKGQMPN